LIDEQLDRDTQLAMKLSSLGRAARSQAGIKVRQPLPYATVGLSGFGEAESLARVAPQIIEELNVKELKSTDNIDQLGDGHVSVSEGGYAVAVPTEISEELLQEGLAREIVHRIQTMRRGADFNIADHILTWYEGDDYVNEVMTGYADYIKQETLSREISAGIPEADVFRESYKLAGRQVTLGVRRAD
jgi:isoleucyl-tRNA synthetase